MLIAERIEEVLAGLDLLPLMEDAFQGYSAGLAVQGTGVQDIALATAVVESCAAG